MSVHRQEERVHMAHLRMTLISDQCHLQCVSNELLRSDKTNKPP